MPSSLLQRIARPNLRPPVLAPGERVELIVSRSGLRYWILAWIAAGFFLLLAMTAPSPEAEGGGNAAGLFTLALVPLGVAWWKVSKMREFVVTNHRLIIRGRRSERSIDLRDVGSVDRVRRFLTWDVRVRFTNGDFKSTTMKRVKNSAIVCSTLVALSRAAAEHKVHAVVKHETSFPSNAGPPVTALSLLDARLARGEISEEEYSRKRALLNGGR